VFPVNESMNDPKRAQALLSAAVYGGGGEVSALIAKRFSVEVTGRGADMAQSEKTLGTVDLARLQAMEDTGAQAH
jgi:hypothetical protein